MHSSYGTQTQLGLLGIATLLSSLTIAKAISSKSANTNKSMVYDIFGAKGINIEIPEDVFPTKDELELMEKKLPGGEHGFFESCDRGQKLHYMSWVPSGEVKGVLVYVHGVNTHCFKAMEIEDRKLAMSLVVDECLKKGVAVYTFDLLGHGFSEGVRFLITDWKDNMADVISFCKLAASKHSDKIPFFLSGESYGGSLAVQTARQFQDSPEKGPSNFDSLLLTAPFIVGDMPGFPVYQVLRYFLAPAFPKWRPFFMPNPVSPDRVWRDKRALKERTDARYLEMGIDGAGQTFRLGTALAMAMVMDDVQSKAVPGLNVPFCTIHGTEDIGVPIEGSELLMEKSVTPDDQKEFHAMDGLYHDMFTDFKAEECIGHWTKFMEKRMKAFSTSKK